MTSEALRYITDLKGRELTNEELKLIRGYEKLSNEGIGGSTKSGLKSKLEGYQILGRVAGRYGLSREVGGYLNLSDEYLLIGYLPKKLRNIYIKLVKEVGYGGLVRECEEHYKLRKRGYLLKEWGGYRLQISDEVHREYKRQGVRGIGCEGDEVGSIVDKLVDLGCNGITVSVLLYVLESGKGYVLVNDILKVLGCNRQQYLGVKGWLVERGYWVVDEIVQQEYMSNRLLEYLGKERENVSSVEMIGSKRKLLEHERLVLECFIEGVSEGRLAKEIGMRVGLSKAAVHANIGMLVKKGYLGKVGKGVYEVLLDTTGNKYQVER